MDELSLPGVEARVFASALGITRDDWRYLQGEIAGTLPGSRVSAVRVPLEVLRVTEAAVQESLGV